MEERYAHLNTFLSEKLGERTLKICIDGGFTCPNRDGKIDTTGCIFCSERGSGEHIAKINEIDFIERQVKNYFSSYKANRANQFIAYFQNFTNTYDSIENLKKKYDASLIDKRIVALAIATRPDCINKEIVSLLQTYTKNHYVWVELGLQTANNETGKLIHRGYSSEQFTRAVNLLNQAGIDVVTHIMVGLPGETKKDLVATVNFLNKHCIQGLKIHSTYVIRNTILGNWYKEGNYIPLTLEEYLESLVYIITHISPHLVIHRITGDSPKHLLLAPEWNLHKKWILNGFHKILKERDLWQGMDYKGRVPINPKWLIGTRPLLTIT